MTGILSQVFGLLERVNNASQCTVPSTDDIYPVHFIDQASIIRSSIISYTFRYNDVLDAQKLHAALVQLLKLGDWRKLSGRLRLDKQGKLEIHVPRECDSGRSIVRFSHRKHDIGIEEHPLAARLPKRTGDLPSVQEGCHSFRSFSIPDDLPNNISHYLTTDEPLLCLHVTSFIDATLVALTFPHSVSDAMGTAGLLKAWSDVLAQRYDLVPPVVGTKEDVLETVGAPAYEKSLGTFILEEKQTKGMSLLLFILRYLWDCFTQRNIRAHHICLPAKFMSHLRRRAEEELKIGSSNTDKAPFISDGDIITAWGASMVMRSRSWKKSVVICNVFDLRGRLEKTFSSSALYLQNLILPSTTILTPAQVQTEFVSSIALQVRGAILTQTTDAQARSLMRLARGTLASTGMMPLFARSDSMVIACTNWSKGRFLEEANFGPAVILRSPGSIARAGFAVAYWGTTLAVHDNPRDTFVNYGRDHVGDYWLHAYLRDETYDLIRAEFREYVSKEAS